MNVLLMQQWSHQDAVATPFKTIGALNFNLNRIIIPQWIAGWLLLDLIALYPLNQLLHGGEVQHLESVCNPNYLATLQNVCQQEEDGGLPYVGTPIR